jgi:hypothetical protein
MWRLWTSLDLALLDAAEPAEFGRAGIDLHRSAARSYAAALSVPLGVATLVLVVGLAVSGEDPAPDALVVFALVATGVALFALGHFDALFLLGLRCAGPAVRALAVGTATLLVAAAGLAELGVVVTAAAVPLGGIAFLIASRRGVTSTMRELDWHYAEAF